MKNLSLVSSLRWVGLLPLVIAASGCGERNDVPHYPVSGIVTLDGKPLAGAGVMFLPRGETRGNACVALTDGEGKYSLKPERGGGTGAPEGEFAVTISKMKDPPPGTGSGPAAAETGFDETLSPKYWDSAQTILSAHVPQGGATIDFPLKSRP
jgi:hypothetical protein